MTTSSRHMKVPEGNAEKTSRYYLDEGELVEYQWEGDYSQVVQHAPHNRTGSFSNQKIEATAHPKNAKEQGEEEAWKTPVSHSADSALGTLGHSSWFLKDEWDGPKVQMPHRAKQRGTISAEAGKELGKETSLRPHIQVHSRKRLDEAVRLCEETFYHPNACRSLNAECKHDFESQRARYCIWQASYLPFIRSTSSHDADGEMVEIVLIMLRRLADNIKTLRNADVLSDPSDDVFSEELCGLDSSTDSASDTAEIQPRHICLKKIDCTISRLYRFASLVQHPLRFKHSRPFGASYDTVSSGCDADKWFERSIKTYLEQECELLAPSSVIHKRLLDATRDRRNRLMATSGTRTTSFPEDVIRHSPPTKEEIRRWNNLEFPPLPTDSCACCSRSISSLLQRGQQEVQKSSWMQHVLQDLLPYVCLASECQYHGLMFSNLESWQEHTRREHDIRYFCQFPGDEGIWFSSKEELELHLHEAHSAFIPGHLVPSLAAQTKYHGRDALLPLLLEWNEGRIEQQNIIICSLCGHSISIFGLGQKFYIDLDRSLKEQKEIPRLLRDHILDHLALHMEALALLALPDNDSNKAQPTRRWSGITNSTSHQSLPSTAFVETPSQSIQTELDPPGPYRWGDDTEGRVPYRSASPRTLAASTSIRTSASHSFEGKGGISSSKPRIDTQYTLGYPQLADYSKPTPSFSHSTPSYSQPTPVYENMIPLPPSIQIAVGGDKKHRHIKTTNDSTPHERLAPSFRRVAQKDHGRFFCRGRVFKMLWTEPASTLKPGGSRSSISEVRLCEGVYLEMRQFVVIQNKGTHSQCVPIHTYRGQGATNRSLIIKDHAIIYTGDPGDKAPQRFHGEEAIVKQPIRVQPRYGESLQAASRIDFGKPYAVEHNVKLCEIGIIAEEHLFLLVHYFAEANGDT